MFVRMTAGKYRGEVRDVVYDSAMALIKRGEASAIDFNKADSQAELVVAAPAAAELPMPPAVPVGPSKWTKLRKGKK